MKLILDAEADVLALVLREGRQSHTKRVAPQIILRYGLDSEVNEIEILGVSRFLSGRKPSDLELDLAPDHSVVEYEVELPKHPSRG